MEELLAKLGSFTAAFFGVLVYLGWGLQIQPVKVR